MAYYYNTRYERFLKKKIDGDFINGCKDGNVITVKLRLDDFRNHITEMNSADDDYGSQRACENGHTEVIKLLFDTFGKLPEMNSTDNYYGFRWACENGHIEVIKLPIRTFNITIPIEYIPTKYIPYYTGYKIVKQIYVSIKISRLHQYIKRKNILNNIELPMTYKNNPNKICFVPLHYAIAFEHFKGSLTNPLDNEIHKYIVWHSL